jgi:hypothetical protein
MESEPEMSPIQRSPAMASYTNLVLRTRLFTAWISKQSTTRPANDTSQKSVFEPLPTATVVETSNMARTIRSDLFGMLVHIRSGFVRASHSHLILNA